MNANAIACSAWKLYVIIDKSALGERDPYAVALAAIGGGADVIQLRDKSSAGEGAVFDLAKRLLPHAGKAGVAVIVNDYVEVACRLEVTGVHVGQEDLPIGVVRSRIGSSKLIGKSTHSVEQALAAQEEGADYLGVGPIFPTPTKPTYESVGTVLIRQLRTHLRIPMVCIGGVDSETLDTVLEAGAQCVAVVRAVCKAADPETAARYLKNQITQFSRSKTPLSL